MDTLSLIAEINQIVPDKIIPIFKKPKRDYRIECKQKCWILFRRIK